jgi:hypothetical protein
MISASPPEDREPVSPELVLVSPPEVAQVAREELPDPPPDERHWPPVVPAAPSAVLDRLPPPPAYPRLVSEAPAAAEPAPPAAEDDGFAPGPPHRRRRAAFALIPLAALLGGVGYLIVMPRPAHRGDTNAAVSMRSGATTSVPKPTTPGGGTAPSQARTTRQGSRSTQTTKRPAATKPATAAKPKAAAAPSQSSKPKPKPASASKPKPASAASGFVPARTWTWPKTSGADGYDMVFLLNGRVVFHARTTNPRVVLPKSFRFQAGTYRWVVRGVPTGTNGRPIVDTTFVLTAAAATRANG